MPPRTNSARRRVSRRRRPQFEKLDERRVLAAYISEILFEPLFGNDQTDQYVEIRGTPQQALTNTYLLSIDGGSFNSGRVRTIFDLSSTTVGNNGYLVLTQAANRYLVDPAANEIESVSQGFRGLPNNMFEATSSFVNNIDAFLNASTFMLVESSVKPLIGDDIDTNDDGVIDRAGTAFGNWTVLDSVSSLRFSTSDHAYGRIVFADNTNYTSIPGATRVLIDSYGYVGRIGESTGYAVDDWVNGTTRDSNNASQNLVYRFDSGFFGQTTPRYLSDRLLDHLGAPNFFGGIRGSAFLDSNKDGIRDANELPLPGASFLVDTNGNGRHDVITTVVDPETFPAGTVLTSKIPGVTLTTTDAQLQSNDTIDVDATFAFQGLGTRTLSQGGIPWFNSTGRLRMDFANPVRSVSAEFANARVTVGYGYIEAFDRLGNSIGSFRTNAISTGERQVATLSFPDDRIAYAVAFGDNNFNTSSPFMSIEALQFSGGEPLAISDANGDFRVNYLYPGPYEVIATDSIYFQTTPTQSPVPADVIGTENYFFEFGFADNEPPQFVFEPVKFPEHSDVGRPLWTIKATDLNVSQKLTYRLLSVAGSAADPLDFALSIDPDTGVLSARRPAALDFEAGATMQITVEVSDGIAAPITGDFVITLEDINEAPVMPLTVFPLEELSPPNTVIGKVVATDVDAGPAGVVRYDILDGNSQGIFAIDPATGDLLLMRPDLLDFETTSSIVLTIAATDNASVPRRVLGPFIIDLSNTNEPPRFVQVAEGLAVREDAASESVVGVIRAIDPDLGQSVRVEVTGGTGSGLMTVDPETGRVSLNTGVRLDYETQPELTLEVQLVDSFDPPLITTGTVTVTVLNVNERPVISLSRTDAVLPEVTFYSGNQVLATATLSDPEGAQLKLDVVGGTGVDLIDLTANNEIKLKPSAVLDYETRSTWNIVLRATELTGSTPLSSETTLNVRVVNENEPPIMPNQSFSVFETARAGTVIAQLSFRDQDAGQRVQLAITGGDTDLLRIDQTGAIRLLDNAVLSSVNRPQLNLEITATDPNNLSTVANVTISVLPVNRPPRPVQFIDPVEFPSNAPFTYKLPAGLFTDADGHQITLSLTGVGTPLPTWLKFNAATGELIGTPAPRDTGDYRLIIQATDNGAPPLTGVLPLSLKLLETALPWHNKSKPEDVDTDGDIDPLDALVVINLLNDTSLTNGQAFIIVPEDGGSRLSKPDVTQDNRVSSRDALVIINRLNSNTPSPEPGSRIGYFVPPLAAQSVDAIFGTDSEDDSEQSLEVLR